MVNQLVIPIHSVVDIITNSSTVIYTGTQDSAINAMIDIIAHILKESGSEKTVNDLYDIRVVSSDDPWRNNLIRQIDAIIESSVYTKSCLVVTPKRDSGDNSITELLASLFSIEEDYN